MVSFEIFVKAMPPSLSELKVLPSFCFAFKIPDDVAASTLDSYVASCPTCTKNLGRTLPATHYIPWSQIIVDLCHCITTCTSTCHWSPVFQIFIGLCHSIILASTCISACHWPSGQLYLLLWWRWSWIVMANFWLNIRVSTVMEFWLWRHAYQVFYILP